MFENQKVMWNDRESTNIFHGLLCIIINLRTNYFVKGTVSRKIWRDEGKGP
jgi:hypothetical protein